MEIRLADLTDPRMQELVLELNMKLQTEGFVRHGQTMPAEQEHRVRTKLIPLLMRDPNVRIFIAYDGSTAVGIELCQFSLSSYWCELTLYIQDLWVEPAFRKSGYGQALVEAAIQFATEQDCCRVELSTSANNRPAAALYQKLGFKGEPRLVADGSLEEMAEAKGAEASSINVVLKLPLTY